MARKLQLINGIPRMAEESATPVIYDETITVVSSGASGNNLDGPISAGVAITLPDSGTYIASELEVYLSGQRIDEIFDYNHIGSGTRTQVSFTFDLEVDDKIRFRIDRGA